MTVRTERNFVTNESFEDYWDALWLGWYTNSDEGRFVIRIQRLGKGPHVTVELSDRDISALRDKFGLAFDPEERASVVLGGVLGIEGRKGLDMVAMRESSSAPIIIQAIGETVRLSVSDEQWAMVPIRLGIGRVSVDESEEGE